LARGVNPKKAWDAAFPGFNPDAFDPVLYDYVAHGRGAVDTLALRTSAPRIDVKAMSAADAHAVRARIALIGASRASEDKGKARLLGQSDVLLLPSYSEGLPYALLEAMAAGAVPVVTRVGAMPDVVTEGQHGLFVPHADPQALAGAIGLLAADRASLLRMRDACRRRVAAAFSIARVADDLRALYSILLKSHVRNRRLGRSPT